MIVRNKQVSESASTAELDFQARALQYCRLKFPEFASAVDEDIFADMVRKGIERGRSHGLTWESALVEFLETMFRMAPNFDAHPKVAALLDEGEGTPDQRWKRMLAATTYDAWRQVGVDYNPEAWGVELLAAPALFDLRGEIGDL